MLTTSSSSPLPMLFLLRVFYALNVWCCIMMVEVEASWQETPSAAMSSTSSTVGGTGVGGEEALQYYTSYPIFAPGGRLLAIEKCMQDIQEGGDSSGSSITGSNNVVIAIHCRDGVVVVTTLTESPYMTMTMTSSSSLPSTLLSNKDSTSTTTTIPLALDLPDTGIPQPPFTRLSNQIWGVTAGRVVDSQILRIKLQRIAEELAYEEGQEEQQPADYNNNNEDTYNSVTTASSILARRMADALQWPTQSLASPKENNDNNDDENGDDDDAAANVSMPLAACALIVTKNIGDIWRVDPTGHFYKCRAAVVGRQAMAIESHLVQEIQQAIRITKTSGMDNKKNKRGGDHYHENGDATSSSCSSSSDPGTSSSEQQQQQQQQAVVEKAQLHEYIGNWTCKDALVAATRSIQAIVSRSGGGSSHHSYIKSTTATSSNNYGIRLQGMSLSKYKKNHQQQHDDDAQWYTDRELKELVVQAVAAESSSSSPIGITPPSSSS